MVVSDISTLNANLSVTQNMISSMSVGQKVSVEVPSASSKRLEGTVAAVSQSASSTTGVFSVKVEIPNKDHLIKGGMFAKVSVPTQTVKDALTVPVSAILHDDGGNYVFVKEGDKAVRKDITLGFSTDTRCQISSGLTKDDLVIVKGQTYISDGSVVTTPQEIEAQSQKTADASAKSKSPNPDSSGTKAG
jgi:RND family efflux transporter MFP subunit